MTYLFKADPKDDSEKESFGYLKRYVRALEFGMLKKLLKFLTGSDMIICDFIQVDFVKFENNFSRRPIADMCVVHHWSCRRVTQIFESCNKNLQAS